MGAYHSFDKREAEAYARSLRKQRERERQAAEELKIWRQLIEEQLAAERARVRPKMVKKREPRAKKKPTVHERGMLAFERLARVIDDYVSDNIAALIIVQDGAPYVTIDSFRIPRHAYLAQTRVNGNFGSVPLACQTWFLQADHLLGDAMLPLFRRLMSTAAMKVRFAAREVLRQSSAEERAQVAQLWRAYRQSPKDKRLLDYIMQRIILDDPACNVHNKISYRRFSLSIKKVQERSNHE
jgi:hypothetical protein